MFHLIEASLRLSESSIDWHSVRAGCRRNGRPWPPSSIISSNPTTQYGRTEVSACQDPEFLFPLVDRRFLFFFIALVLDMRVENWLFMSSPLVTLSICLAYVSIVKVFGPAYMKNRPPFELRRVLIVYNFLQVVFSVWLFYEVAQEKLFPFFTFQVFLSGKKKAGDS